MLHAEILLRVIGEKASDDPKRIPRSKQAEKKHNKLLKGLLA